MLYLRQIVIRTLCLCSYLQRLKEQTSKLHVKWCCRKECSCQNSWKYEQRQTIKTPLQIQPHKMCSHDQDWFWILSLYKCILPRSSSGHLSISVEIPIKDVLDLWRIVFVKYYLLKYCCFFQAFISISPISFFLNNFHNFLVINFEIEIQKTKKDKIGWRKCDRVSSLSSVRGHTCLLERDSIAPVF